jgi:rhomboid family GlyGly-CTERM serine protease
LLVLAASVVYWLPEGNPLFIYDRDQILNGEVWRLITGHLVHLSPEHFGNNLVLFALTGCWLEYRIGLPYAWMPALTSVVAGVYFLFFLPDMAHYGGLSGLASVNVVYLCLLESARNTTARPLWLSMLLLFAAKVGYEILNGKALFVDGTRFEVVPSVHIIGAVVALSVFIASVRARGQRT